MKNLGSALVWIKLGQMWHKNDSPRRQQTRRPNFVRGFVNVLSFSGGGVSLIDTAGRTAASISQNDLFMPGSLLLSPTIPVSAFPRF